MICADPDKSGLCVVTDMQCGAEGSARRRMDVPEGIASGLPYPAYHKQPVSSPATAPEYRIPGRGFRNCWT